MCTFFIKCINGNSCLFLFSVCYIKILFTFCSQICETRTQFSPTSQRSQSFQIYIYIFLFFHIISLILSISLSTFHHSCLASCNSIIIFRTLYNYFYNIPASYRNAIRRTQKKVKLRITENQDIRS